VKTGGGVPAYVYILVISPLIFGVWCLLKAVRRFRAARSLSDSLVLAPGFQVLVWASSMAGRSARSQQATASSEQRCLSSP
jgi:hypothetical protein